MTDESAILRSDYEITLTRFIDVGAHQSSLKPESVWCLSSTHPTSQLPSSLSLSLRTGGWLAAIAVNSGHITHARGVTASIARSKFPASP